MSEELGKPLKISPASVKQRLFLQSKTDICLYGGGAGAGKTYQALMKALEGVHDPNYRAVFIRNSRPQLTNPGAIIDESKGLYKYFNPKFRQDILEYTFPSGAKISFKAIDSPKDLAGFDGTQFSFVCFDEAQNNFEDAVIYLLSRLRSKYKGKHSLAMTANPRSDCWLKSWVEYCLDDDGVPKQGTEDIVRWFVRIDNRMIWADTKEELLERFPESSPLSFQFVPATVEDNPPLKILRPEYVSQLQALKRVDYLRLYKGSWSAREEANSYWRSSWCEMVEPADVPENLTHTARGWDTADTVPSESNRDPDYTCGVKLARDPFGTYFILDAYRFRKRSGEMMQEFASVAHDDGVMDCEQVVQKDGGSAGAAFFRYFATTMAEQGIPIKADQISGWAGKVKRFLPFAALCENGSVKIVKGAWNDWFIDELEAFDGTRKNVHDDAVDAVGTAFRHLAKQNVLPTFKLPDLSRPSPTAGL